MSDAPYLSLNIRQSARMGNVEMKDHMVLVGLRHVAQPDSHAMCADGVRRGLPNSAAPPRTEFASSPQPAVRAQKEGQFRAEHDLGHRIP